MRRKEILSCIGTEKGKLYTREEIVELLLGMQDEIIRDYRSRFGNDLFNRKYFAKCLEAAAGRSGISGSRGVRELTRELEMMNETIRLERQRISEEDRSQRALGRTLPGEEMEVISGFSVKGTDYDAVVITPYGVFVVEVAGAAKKGTKELLDLKELLLRDTLKSHPNVPFYGVMLSADGSRSAEGMSTFDTVLSDIRSYSDGTRHIAAKEMAEISGELREVSEPVKVECPVDCGKIVREYSMFVNRCEEKKKSELLRKLFGLPKKPDVETV